MPTDKDLKQEFRKKTEKHPEQYYAVSVLKEEGFVRKRCAKCSRFFWTAVNSDICGDASCQGRFKFIGGTPAKHKLGYVEVWEKFAEHFKKLGYEPIKRYPVAARWRDDTDFVQASIYDFQPYVVSGEVEPPANPLVVPQFCLRFNDIDNVGITGAHYTGFVMIGQHAFMPPKKWKQDDYFRDIHSWLKKGLGLPNEEITFHEDAWAGGGNFGPCMEYFSRGLELGNQVYMQYEITPSGPKELKLKVLDMGMGQERNAWFTGGTSTSYETTFPSVCKKLRGVAGIKANDKLISSFLPYASLLNVDEVENIENSWKKISKETGISVEELKKNVIPLSQLYSVAEHSRSLLVAVSDGVLPSNIAGGYNLRVILRRALSFIDKNKWNLELAEICEWHAEFLKKQFPELSENLDEISEILEVEKKKYYETKGRIKQLVGKIASTEIGEKRLLELYDSQGISPELIKEEAAKFGRKVKIPDNFYAKIAQLHDRKEQKTAMSEEGKIDSGSVRETKALYFDDYAKTKFKAHILKVMGNNVILDETYFYPTSGGQEHDTGTIANEKVVDVFKQGNIIVHVLNEKHEFLEGELVNCEIDFERRKQLAQHHTSTHIINGLCRKMLGNHIWQAGAAKFIDKARLDITHYASLTDEQVKEIETQANEIIKNNLPVHKFFMERAEAERKYGFILYQGGVAPGKLLRIVNVEGLDVEACGGTHLNSTGEAELIKILKTSKIQDGIVRIEFAAGNAAKKIRSEKEQILEEAARLLNCDINQIPGRTNELFEKWKSKVKKGKQIEAALTSTENYEGDVLEKTASILKTQPEHITKTIRRFLEDIKAD